MKVPWLTDCIKQLKICRRRRRRRRRRCWDGMQTADSTGASTSLCCCTNRRRRRKKRKRRKRRKRGKRRSRWSWRNVSADERCFHLPMRRWWWWAAELTESAPIGWSSIFTMSLVNIGSHLLLITWVIGWSITTFIRPCHCSSTCSSSTTSSSSSSSSSSFSSCCTAERCHWLWSGADGIIILVWFNYHPTIGCFQWLSWAVVQLFQSWCCPVLSSAVQNPADGHSSSYPWLIKDGGRRKEVNW